MVVGLEIEAESTASETEGFRTLDQIKEDGTVIIGVFSDKAPFGYVDDAGEYQGYDVEFANRLVTDLGTQVEWVATDPANRVPFLESNKVDIILANFTVTDEEIREAARLANALKFVDRLPKGLDTMVGATRL